MANFISARANVPISRVIWEGEAIILGNSTIGGGTRIGNNVLIGYPSKEKWKDLKVGTKLGWEGMDQMSGGSIIDKYCVIRSNTVIYETVAMAANVSTGHNVLLRENTRIGRGSLIGSGSIIDGEVVVGEHVSIQSSVYLPPLTKIGDNVFIGPCVVLTNDRYPASSRLVGVSIEEDAVIGANATLMAGITIKQKAVVAAGAVVVHDAPADTVVAGVPAKPIGNREDYEKKKTAYEHMTI